MLVLEIQDRFGCLFLDFKGSPRLCFMFGALKQAAWALRGVLLGVFIGGRPLCPIPSTEPESCAAAQAPVDKEPASSIPTTAGLAAQTQTRTAISLLSLLLALQAAFTLLALALRPYISVVLNCIEIACSCLDIAYLAATMAAYLHTSGVLLDDRQQLRQHDHHLAVGAWWLLVACKQRSENVACTCTTQSIITQPS